MKSNHDLSWAALLHRRGTPTIICKNPQRTNSFIFKELMKCNSLHAPSNIQSTSNGYGILPPLFLTSWSGV